MGSHARLTCAHQRRSVRRATPFAGVERDRSARRATLRVWSALWKGRGGQATTHHHKIELAPSVAKVGVLVAHEAIPDEPCNRRQSVVISGRHCHSAAVSANQ